MRQIRPAPALLTKYILWVWFVFLCTLPMLLLVLAPEIGWLFVIIFLGANLLWAVPTTFLMSPYYRSISYELTDDEIIVRKGILTKTEKTVPYHQITNIEIKRGLLDRILGIGTVDAQTAGYSQQAGAEAPLPGLEDWEGVRREVMAHVRRKRASTDEAPALELGADADAVPALLSEILAELRAVRGSIDAGQR